MSKHVAKKTFAVKISVVTGALAVLLAGLAPLSANAAVPGLTSVSPSSGTAAGGTTIVITGTGFTGVNCPAGVKVGGVPVQSCVVDSITQITALLPTRAGTAKTIGPQDISVTNGLDTSVAGSLRYTYVPTVEIINENLVILGDLASRSQRNLVTRSTSAPYQVFGTDSLSGDPYSYVTNFDYVDANEPGWLREGDQPGYHDNAGTPYLGTADVTQTTYGTRETYFMESDGDCDSTGNRSNTFDSGQGNFETYCTVFGPEIYSESFYATSSQALAFEWKALGNQDDYSVYAYLVAVTDETIPTPSTTNNKLVMHAVGSRDNGATQYSDPGQEEEGWTTSTANVTATGLYRFRFVNGSYDGTGGQAIGSDFYIGSVLLAGDRNDITLTSPGDKISITGSWTTTASATSGQRVDIVSLTPTVCTVTYTGAPTTTATISQNGTTLGTCTLQASQGATGTFAPAATVTTSFDIRASAVAPEAPTITSVTPGNTQLTVNFNAPNRDGGAPITKYQYQVDAGPAWVDLPSTAGPFTIAGLTNGTTYQIKVRAVNSAGDGTASGQSPGTPADVLTITSANTKSAVVGTSLTHTLTGSSGTAPYTWTTTALPAGLSLIAGVISGTPTTAGTTSVTVTITDSVSGTTTQVLTITISAAGGGGSSGGTNWSSPVTVTPAPIVKRSPVTITIGGFKPGSPVLTKQIQAAIKKFIAKNPGYKNVIATGVTDGPTVLKVDKNLSKTRATNALSFITKTLKAPVKVAAVKSKQETRKGSAVRRIVLTLTD